MFKSKEYKYFKKKLGGIQYAIWDNEFKRFKTAEIREEIRKEYDSQKGAILMFEEKLKGKDIKAEEKDKITDNKVRAEAERDRLEAQIKGLEKEIHGGKPNAEEPNGYDGLDQTIDSLYELKDMVRDYTLKM